MKWRRAATIVLVVIAGLVATAGTLAVTAAGFALSFDAIRAVGIAASINRDIAWMLPVAIDGAMAVAMVTAIVLRSFGQKPWYPWAVVIIGAAVSILCNAGHASIRGGALELPTEYAMAVSAIPAAFVALSVHMLVVLAIAVISGPATDDEPEEPTATAETATGEPVTVEPVVPPTQPASTPSPEGEDDAPEEPVTAGQRLRSDERTAVDVAVTILALRAAQPDWSRSRIAAAVGRSEATVRRVLGAQNAAPVSGPPANTDPSPQMEGEPVAARH